jgi:hypothetical protein
VNFDNTGYGALPLDQSVAGVMDAEALDFGTLSLTGRVVDDHEGFFGSATLSQPILTGGGDILNFPGPRVEKPLEIVGSGLEIPLCYFLRRVELDQTDQPDEISQEMFSLGPAQEPQENRKIGRNFFGRSFAYGFHVDLLALHGIGDFGWKPFYLKQLTSFVT